VLVVLVERPQTIPKVGIELGLLIISQAAMGGKEGLGVRAGLLTTQGATTVWAGQAVQGIFGSMAPVMGLLKVALV